eukprot:CAMPEP_0175948788 /NCGR_PEP_ID=MMETSP0108-20121206/28660_1 /TAXON_ID=195067 ORGANISM="Goniomonas pacifica, Strain CCMP1869" /NCGR_SAMPLE_ID=MMETSP0108 /ASSEMBLY_ACC=CAM_ASM_000204 /LENGTH=671 /DNA_ID=CAMNT_0017274617 /DNA_START=104 /DNA_END=2119 /DNA_ORIENTATION=+
MCVAPFEATSNEGNFTCQPVLTLSAPMGSEVVLGEVVVVSTPHTGASLTLDQGDTLEEVAGDTVTIAATSLGPLVFHVVQLLPGGDVFDHELSYRVVGVAILRPAADTVLVAEVETTIVWTSLDFQTNPLFGSLVFSHFLATNPDALSGVDAIPNRGTTTFKPPISYNTGGRVVLLLKSVNQGVVFNTTVFVNSRPKWYADPIELFLFLGIDSSHYVPGSSNLTDLMVELPNTLAASLLVGPERFQVMSVEATRRRTSTSSVLTLHVISSASSALDISNDKLATKCSQAVEDGDSQLRKSSLFQSFGAVRLGFCGDGKRQSGEECDAGEASVACTSCTVRTGWQCTGGTYVTADSCETVWVDPAWFVYILVAWVGLFISIVICTNAIAKKKGNPYPGRSDYVTLIMMLLTVLDHVSDCIWVYSLKLRGLEGLFLAGLVVMGLTVLYNMVWFAVLWYWVKARISKNSYEAALPSMDAMTISLVIFFCTIGAASVDFLKIIASPWWLVQPVDIIAVAARCGASAQHQWESADNLRKRKFDAATQNCDHCKGALQSLDRLETHYLPYIVALESVIEDISMIVLQLMARSTIGAFNLFDTIEICLSVGKAFTGFAVIFIFSIQHCIQVFNKHQDQQAEHQDPQEVDMQSSGAVIHGNDDQLQIPADSGFDLRPPV